MKKSPLRNRSNYRPDDGVDAKNHNLALNRDPETLPQKIRRIYQSLPDAATHTKPTVRICERVLARDPYTMATWDEVLSTKSLQSPISSMLDSNTTTTQPVHQMSARILEMPGNTTAASHNNNANRNGNKDDDDNNPRSSRQQQRIIETASAEPSPVMPAASASEFMTFERLKLGDQINFLQFDPYRTLKFLITELKSRLKTLVPDDVNVHRILVEIQQTMKRIRIPNATESSPPPPRTTTKTDSPAPVAPEEPAKIVGTPIEATVECILPKERCHVIKEDPLINHARKVNSSCQTIGPQLENVNACQMCEHQVKQGAAGCNQKRLNGNSNAEDMTMMEEDIVSGTHQGSKDHSNDIKVAKRFSCKFLQDAIQNLKIKSNPFSDGTQKIITQLEAELLKFQRELQRTTPSSLSEQQQQEQPFRIKSTTENLKVQCKRLLNEERENAEQEEETFPDFIAKRSTSPPAVGKKLDFSNQAAAITTSKESQTNVKSATQMFCHLEKEKLLLVQQFRASEMQNIQGDLNELHVFIKDQLDDIYHSITSENLNLKYHSNGKGGAHKGGKNRQKSHHTFHGEGKTSLRGLQSSSSPSLTAFTSSVLSSTEIPDDVGVTPLGSFILTGHYKNSNAPDDGNANNSKSMMKQKQKQKSSSSSISAADAKESHNVDKVNKALGEKKSEDHHNHQQHRHQQHHHQDYNQNHLYAHFNCCAPIYADPPNCNGKQIHFPAVESEGYCPHTGIQRMMTADAARTSAQGDIKSTTKTSPQAMTCHQHCQQCHQQSRTTFTAQEQTQLISSSLPGATVPPGRLPPYFTMQSTVDETAQKRDDVTNAAVKTSRENAYANAAATAEHSDGIRTHKHHQSYEYQAHNSWHRVNPKNSTGCQPKKQIFGDRYEHRINNSHSNYPEIHDCQKCRSNCINPSGGLCSAKMHEVGSNNAPGTVPQSDDDGGDRNDSGAGGDGPNYWDAEAGIPVFEDFSSHTGQRKPTAKQYNRPTREPFQTDLEELKNYLDEIIHTSPRYE